MNGDFAYLRQDAAISRRHEAMLEYDERASWCEGCHSIECSCIKCASCENIMIECACDDTDGHAEACPMPFEPCRCESIGAEFRAKAADHAADRSIEENREAKP